MREAKNTARAVVRIGYDGRVHKTFRAAAAEERFDNEVRVLRYLEEKQCDFVPRLLDSNRESLTITTSNCGARVEQLSQERIDQLFLELESYGVRHDDPYLRNITYRASDGRFCIIDFEFATILDETSESSGSSPNVKTTGVNPGSNQQMHVRWSAMTDRGRFRPNNEDAFLAIAFDLLELHYLGRQGEVQTNRMDFVFAVSDGMGGERSGEFASRFAIENITRLLPRRFLFSPAHYQSGFRQILSELIDLTHRQLTQLGRSYEEGRRMGATLSLVWLVGDWLYYAHIGDSRIYHLPASGGMNQLTEDHTHVGWLRRQGQINERQARTHPRRNMLAQALGAEQQFLCPQLGAMRLERGDAVLLCTDGLNEGLWDRALEEAARRALASDNLDGSADRLVREAVLECGRDNATAVLVQRLAET